MKMRTVSIQAFNEFIEDLILEDSTIGVQLQLELSRVDRCDRMDVRIISNKLGELLFPENGGQNESHKRTRCITT